jgi:hypothetical protein
MAEGIMIDMCFLDPLKGLRVLPWSELINDPPEATTRGTLRRWQERADGRGLRRGVPRYLRHVGCMWFEGGDERRRCGARVAWVMGDPFARARVYCEEHGREILRVVDHRRGGGRLCETVSDPTLTHEQHCAHATSIDS